MSDQPFVTVVIPTFNHAKLLRRALDSVVAQTFDNWEAIVINNFSTDETIEVVESYQDDRIKLLPRAIKESKMQEENTLHFLTLTTTGTQKSCKSVSNTQTKELNSFATAKNG
jgi:glycosyltransferase involved in cell wall biosynthesis